MIPSTPPHTHTHKTHRYVERERKRDLLHSLVILAIKYIYNSNESIVLPKWKKKYLKMVSKINPKIG